MADFFLVDRTRTTSTQILHMHWYIYCLCGIFWQGRSVYPKVWMLITSRAPVHSFYQYGRKKPPAINPWSLVCIGVSTPSSKTPPPSFLPSPPAPLNQQTSKPPLFRKFPLPHYIGFSWTLALKVRFFSEPPKY